MSKIPEFAALKNKRRAAAVIKTLRDVVTGKPVSHQRLTTAQNLCAELLAECNARRPLPPIYCGGRIPPLQTHTGNNP